MAGRTRYLKASFFKNEELATLSPYHRLCFQGLWCYADRQGRLEDRPKRLKAEVFPYDDVDIDELLGDLMQKGFIVRYQVDGVDRFIEIPRFVKHQCPHPREAKSVIPAFDETVHVRIAFSGKGQSKAVPRTHLGDPCTLTGSSGSSGSSGSALTGSSGSEDVHTASAVCVDVEPSTPSANGQAERIGERPEDLQAVWNEETLSPIPRCRELTAQRRKKAKARLKERPLTAWRDVFRRIQASAFCRGETDRGGWKASFDWILDSADNAVKVLEGKYDDRAGPLAKAEWCDECQHAPRCRSQELHNVRLDVEAICEHEPKCDSFGKHHKLTAEEPPA